MTDYQFVYCNSTFTLWSLSFLAPQNWLRGGVLHGLLACYMTGGSKPPLVLYTERYQACSTVIVGNGRMPPPGTTRVQASRENVSGGAQPRHVISLAVMVGKPVGLVYVYQSCPVPITGLLIHQKYCNCLVDCGLTPRTVPYHACKDPQPP